MHDVSARPDAGIAASAFDAARKARRSLPIFPGDVPQARAAAYAIQDAQIEQRGERVVAWKVAMTAAPYRDAFGEERLSGPVFASRLSDRRTGGDATEWSVIPGGFAAVEAEFVAVIGRNLPIFGRMPSSLEVLDFVADLHIGIELAGSPLAAINDLGPFAVASDCGNNDGIVVGPAVPDWRTRPLTELTARMTINGESAGTGSAASIKGGPLEAVAFLARHLETRGKRLMAGDFVSTGATTGIHKVRPGDQAVAAFGPTGMLAVRVA